VIGSRPEIHRPVEKSVDKTVDTGGNYPVDDTLYLIARKAGNELCPTIIDSYIYILVISGLP
jgi:hypothetical protein